ncbi:MAG: histidine kinase [Polyangiaceae bacterium]
MGSAASLAWVRYALPILVLVAALVALGFVPSRPHPSIASLAHWDYRVSEVGSTSELNEPLPSPRFTPIELPSHPSGPGRVLWMRTRIPENVPPDAVVAIDAVVGPFTAYVDGARVFAHPEPDGVSSRGKVGVPWVLIPIAAGSGGKTLTLAIGADYRPMGVKGTPVFGSRADLLASTVERDLPRVVVAFISMLLAVLGLVSFQRREGWRLPVGFFVWGISLGTYVLHYTHLKDVVADVSGVSFFAWLVALAAMPVGGALFLDELFAARASRALHVLLRLSVGFLPFYFAALAGAWVLFQSPAHSALGVSLFALATNAVRILILGAAVSVLVEVLRFAKSGDVDARIFMVGFGCLLAFTLRDVLAAFGAALLSWRSQVHVGVLGCVVAMAICLQRRHVALHERARQLAETAAEQAQEKEALVRDLHDGIGALMSNIRMLAELGQRNDSRARVALERIAELSDKSLAELRAYVQTLDDAEASWERHIAELRRFGANLVEAHGRQFEMQVELGTEERPPTLLSLHLLRTFSEGLTNALKRGDGSFVRVALSVLPSELRLRMENDGKSAEASAPSVGGGRGVANLRTRAEELGGELRVDVGDVTQLELRVPLPLRVQHGSAALRALP